MDKMRMKSSGKDSSKSARSTKSASETSKSIAKNFMKGLITTEELIKKKENNNKGLVRLRVVLSPSDIKKFNPKMQINKEFIDRVKELKKTNDKVLRF